MARILRPTPENVAAAAVALRAGRLVAFPTETVYGLGAVATSDRAVAGLFAAKGRPRFNPLIVHVRDRAAATPLADWGDPRAERLAARFWPGPLTLVLRRRPESPLSLLVSAGLDTVALRAPSHPVARALLEAVLLPVAAPSANPSGRVSPTTAEHVAEGFPGDGQVAIVLDGGSCPIGLESTVVDLTGPVARLLRPGGLARTAVEAEIGGPLAAPPHGGATAPTGPGQLASHYAPARPVRLNATGVAPDEALLAFGSDPPAGAAYSFNLSPAGDLTEAAANLFAGLRALDRDNVRAIAVMPVPEEGLGEAINDRLRRAAAPRPDAGGAGP